MKEQLALVEAYEPLRRAGRPAVLATVVAVAGSTYRRPGARMLVTEGHWHAGSLSGGCLERDVLQKSSVTHIKTTSEKLQEVTALHARHAC